MIDRIDKDKFNELCIEKSANLEELAKETNTPFETLRRAQNTGYIPSKVLKQVCKALDVKPKELTRRMPFSAGGMSGLD